MTQGEIKTQIEAAAAELAETLDKNIDFWIKEAKSPDIERYVANKQIHAYEAFAKQIKSISNQITNL